MISITDIVPTNTTADWYKKIHDIKSEYCNLKLYQSRKEDWLEFKINFRCPVVKHSDLNDTYIGYSVLNLISTSIVKLNTTETLKNYCTFVTEEIPYIRMNESNIPNFQKNVSIIFKKNILEENYEIISSKLKELFLDIEEEIELIQKDNLARGKLIELARVFASQRTSENRKYWEIGTSTLECKFDETGSSEYWGNAKLCIYDFVAETQKFPWMPSDICREDPIPF